MRLYKQGHKWIASYVEHDIKSREVKTFDKWFFDLKSARNDIRYRYSGGVTMVRADRKGETSYYFEGKFRGREVGVIVTKVY